MQKCFRVIIITILISCLLSGCSVPFLGALSFSPAKDAVVPETDGDAEGEEADNAYITAEEDSRIKTLIRDFFSSLYAEPVQDYYSYAVVGKIPDKVRSFISKNTINMAEGNNEISIHYPRFIETNGLVCIEYKVDMDKTAESADVPAIRADFAGSSGNSILYYTRVNLYAKCIGIEDFEKLFILNEADNSWKKADNKPIDEKLTDTIKIQARYDVHVTKEDGNYKLDAIKEAVTTYGIKSRLLTYNNDFVERVGYLDYSKSEDGESYVNTEDGKVYEEERRLIVDFFSSLKNSLNAENMRLLHTAWDKSAAEFSSFIGKISQSGDEGEKKFHELIDIRDDYRIRYDYDSLPLQMNMERLDGEFSEMEVIPHPGYTKNRKVYIVTFQVPVIKVNGSVEGIEYIYRYNYFVTLANDREMLKIDSIKLNEYNRVNAENA